jgi:hypothetical protein
LRCSLVALLLLCAGPARAFDDPGQFFAPPTFKHAATLSASAEGVYFTGAPRFTSLDCSSCHTDGPNAVDIRIGAKPDSLFTDGYQPGLTYELEIALVNESLGTQYNTPSGVCTEPPGKTDHYTYQQCNNNNFALEIDSANGPLVGMFCAATPSGSCPPADPVGDEVQISPDGDAVFANRAHSAMMPKQVLRNGATSWHLWWTAPPAGTGPLTFYAAAVDGNGGSGTPTNDQDPYGDDTVRATISLQEQGAQVPTGAQAGCDVAGRSAGAPGFLALFLVGILVLNWRRWRTNWRAPSSTAGTSPPTRGLQTRP